MGGERGGEADASYLGQSPACSPAPGENGVHRAGEGPHQMDIAGDKSLHFIPAFRDEWRLLRKILTSVMFVFLLVA